VDAYLRISLAHYGFNRFKLLADSVKAQSG
jgi:hypothetical protein